MRNRTDATPKADIAALVNAGLALWNDGKMPDALKCYQQAADALTEDTAPEVTLRVLSDYALVLRCHGDARGALEIYETLAPRLDADQPLANTIFRQWAIAHEATHQFS